MPASGLAGNSGAAFPAFNAFASHVGASSPASQIRFLQMLCQLEESRHAQFVITTHSPILLAYPGAQLFSFDGPRIKEVAYEDTAHYCIYKQFFTDRSVFFAA